jgi:PleD family two-component response regulator
MLTTTGTIDLTGRVEGTQRPTDAQTVVVVNGSTEEVAAIGEVLGEGRYQVVFVEPKAHAYSQIKRVHPDLIVMFADLDDDDGFRVLSMLKLDDETRTIPVLTYIADRGDEDEDAPDDAPDQSALTRPGASGVGLMN